MPQHRRKLPFSNKQKKEQLKARKEKRQTPNKHHGEVESKPETDPPDQNVKLSSAMDDVETLNSGSSGGRNRYCLKFKKDVMAKKEKYHHIPFKNPESPEEVTTESFFVDGLDFPKRPAWNEIMSTAELDQSENRYFRLFTEDLDKKFDNLGIYELNLETWRQLWRVIEMSKILLINVDARFAVAQFPPYLYSYLTENGKGVILVINKCDLIPPSLLNSWQDYFMKKYPELQVFQFSSFEANSTNPEIRDDASKNLLNLVNICEKLNKFKVNLSTWRKKIDSSEENNLTEDLLKEDDEITSDDILTLGIIGQPNVGKSSFINAIMGKKVVSVSKTPGHTKYFQTIFITKNVKFCDSPGLVFPSICSKELQILMGSYPVAQVRDPLSCIYYIGCRLKLPSLLHLPNHQLKENGVDKWTPFLICEAWAKKRGYFTRTKGGRADAFRGANEILRFCLTGFKSLLITLKPVGFSQNNEICGSDIIKTPVGATSYEEDAAEAAGHSSFSEEEESTDSSDSEDTSIRKAVHNKFSLLQSNK